MSTVKPFHLPDLGEGLPDAEIVEWHVKIGDVVRLDAPLVSMETAKAVVEVPSPVSGKVLKLSGGAGDVIVTGTPGGVGAARVCRLSTGDMPERITVWKPEQELKFIVLDTPAAMREATIFGRDLDGAHLHTTYTSLDGGFRLEALPNGQTRLTGTSRYLLAITPASYWNLWTREIVSQVQLRVMNHVKAKAEAAQR